MSTRFVTAESRLGRFASAAVFVFFLFAIPITAPAEDEQSIAALRRMGKAFASIAEKASPAVVGIRAEKTVKRGGGQSGQSPFRNPFSPFDEDLFEYFFRRQSPRQYERPESKQVAQGSGFIIAQDGYILTNNHLVGEAEEITVQMADDRKLKAKLIGTDPETDVALIKIDETDLPYVELANSDTLEVGEWVIAIGNPFGLSHTVTAGIVSAKGRSELGVATYEDFIQTDAAINFGNSGGPLLNLDGKAVGINTAIIGPGGNVGIGLAIPSNMARDVYRELKETGTMTRGFLGVLPSDLTAEMTEFFGLDEAKGVLISQVNEDSAAEKAGFKRGDVVIELDGQPVESANDFRGRVAKHKPGSKIKIVVLRDGKRQTLTATLEERSTGLRASAERPDVGDRLGMTVQTLTAELAQRLGYDGLRGVVVTEVEPGSEADEKGIQRGSLIREVDREEVDDVRQFNAAIEKAQPRGKALLLVRYDTVDRYVVLDLSE